jgi:4,5-DOPA dioxygenase extradiol
MPTIFFGHGNPMNALLQNGYTEGWRDIGGRIPKPKAILSISAHWYVPGVALTGAAPRTIHDFGGFPPELFEFDYPAPGSPQLVARVQELLANEGSEVGIDESWGLDHGTWSVLCHVFRDADVPVVQLSIDETRAAPFHYALGQRLQPLRDEGILIMGSGDIVHNLHTYAWGRHSAQPYDWALRFESRARQLMLDGNHAPLVDYESLGRDAVLSVPTPEHYLPLLYVLGASDKGDPVTFPVEGIDGGSVSMLTVQFG